MQDWERSVRSDLETALHDALRSLRATLETRLQQELNAGLANALHDATPPVQQALQRRIRSWSAQLPPPPVPLDPWPGWLAALLDSAQPPQLLQALFMAASNLAPRVAIYVIRGGAAVNWRSAGFDAPIRISLDGHNAFALAAAEARALSWRTDRPLQEPLPMGFVTSLAGGLHPLVVRDKTIGLLYYECGSEMPDGQLEPRLSALLRVAGLALDQIMRRTGRSADDSPAPSPVTVSTTRFPAVPPPATAAAPAAATAVAAAPAPAPVRPSSATEARARRFAKVLMQDLELYLKRDRPQDLNEARAQRDVYQRLREDLDKCQQSFLEKFPAGSGVDLSVLEQQIIEILCQGDRGMMGASYAGLH